MPTPTLAAWIMLTSLPPSPVNTHNNETSTGERESRFLTTHQHILGYTVSFTLYDLHTMDSRQLKMTDDRLQ